MGTMSGLEFDALPYEEGQRWELLEGDLIEVPGATPRHQTIVFMVLTAIQRYLRKRGLPCLAFAKIDFALAENIRLRPDVCVLLEENARGLDLDRTPTPGAPDLAIEVISPSERATESHAKVRACLRYGAAEVWQLYPKSRTLEIHKGEASTCLEADQLVTTDLLPGFSAPLSSFFD